MLMRTTRSNPMLTRTNNLRSNPILKQKCLIIKIMILSPGGDADHDDNDQ